MPGPGPNEKEPQLPDKTRPEDQETDVERQEPVRRPADDSDVEEAPSRRGGGQSGDIERDATPPAREGHDREMQERRPHRDEPV
ncbi:MAG TPA: hypothetical protein VIG06_28590 [Kofleriaceae bacterium]|jgi:hypothetical protein